ncbi:MAG: hypothetical protein AAGD43_10490 [Pseudomonadota bacterium]
MSLVLLWFAAYALAAEPAKKETPQAKDDPNCIEQFRRVCSKVRIRKCRVVMKEDCAMRPANRCRDKLVEKCVPQARQVCRNVGGRNECRYETKRRCQRVIRQVCDRRLERRCKRVPKTVCANEPETRCERRRFYACSGRKGNAGKAAVK